MKDYKYKLSIIIPMYNAEKYIANCLDSILNSDLPKDCYEVIIINDGSKDKGSEIAQEYVRQYDFFVYLTQENQGTSVAFNSGLKVAKGEYVWFVGSDDKIFCNVAVTYRVLVENNLDSLVSRMIVVDEDGNQIAPDEYYDIECNKVIKGREVFFSNFPIGSVCCNFIKRDFLLKHNLFFKAGITQQDVEFSNRLFAYAEKVMFVNNCTYVYIKHSSSVTMSSDIVKRKKYILDSIEIILSLQLLSKEVSDFDVDLSKRISNKSNDTLLGLTFGLFRNKKVWKTYGINDAVVRKLKAEGLYPMKCHFNSWKKKLFSMILNFEPLIV